MRVIPETAKRQDWPRLVARTVNALSRKVTDIEANGVPNSGSSGGQALDMGSPSGPGGSVLDMGGPS